MVGPLDVTTGIWHIQAYLFLVLIANGENVKVVEETSVMPAVVYSGGLHASKI